MAQIPGVNGGWHYLHDPNAIHIDGKTITGAVRTEPSPAVIAIEYDHATEETTTVVLDSELNALSDTEDEHATPMFEELPDGRLIAFWDRSSPFRIAIADDAADITTFPENSPYTANVFNNINYANPIYLPATDEMHIFYRKDGDMVRSVMADVSNTPDADWGDPAAYEGPTVIRTEVIRNYPHCRRINDSEIMVMRTGHPIWTENNDLWVARYNTTDDAWYDARALNQISTDADLPLTRDDYDLVRPAADGDPRASEMRLDENGVPHIVYARYIAQDGYDEISNEGEGFKEHAFDYSWPDENGVWQHHEITRSEKAAVDPSQGFGWAYFGGITIDPDDTSHIYYARKYGGERQFEIYEATTSDGGETWDETPVTQNSEYKQTRPRSVMNSQDGLTTMWMSGEFNRYNDYNTTLLSTIGDPPEQFDPTTPPEPPTTLVGSEWRRVTLRQEAAGDWQRVTPRQVGSDGEVTTATPRIMTEPGREEIDYSPPNATELLARWDFSEIDASDGEAYGTIPDHSGNGHSLEATNVTHLAGGINGMSVAQFSGDGVLTGPDTTELDIRNSDVTVSVYIVWQSTDASQVGYIMHQSPSSSGGLQGFGQLYHGGNSVVDYNIGGSTLSNPEIVDTEPHMTAALVNRPAGEADISWNGELESMTTGDAGDPENLRIGARYDSSSGSAVNFDGYVGEVLIYDGQHDEEMHERVWSYLYRWFRDDQQSL